MDTFLNYFTPLNLSIFLLVLVIIDRFLQYRKTKQEVTDHFYGHVNKNILQKVRKKASKIKLYGEEKVITTMFLDIKGFTAMSERLSNKEVVKNLNRYLSNISKVVLAHDGTIDKYIGDAVMAFWGAPLQDKLQATKAVKAANEIREMFDNEEVDIRIGINTGPAIVGNVGNYEMISYTAIGDSINLAARLESLNKKYGTRVIISKNTLDKYKRELGNLHSDIFVREIDKVRVYGKREVTQIFELVGIMEELDEKTLNGYEYFEHALYYYRKGNWDDAEELFRKASRRIGSDSVSKEFIERCKSFKPKPLSATWTGVMTLGK